MKQFLLAAILFSLALAFPLNGWSESSGEKAPKWNMNATVIEACSCPMFCQCYLNSKPSMHHEEGGKHFCRANNAYKINKGSYSGVTLDGSKFWVSTDLGGDFSKGEMDWAVLTFDKALTQLQ